MHLSVQVSLIIIEKALWSNHHVFGKFFSGSEEDLSYGLEILRVLEWRSWLEEARSDAFAEEGKRFIADFVYKYIET